MGGGAARVVLHKKKRGILTDLRKYLDGLGLLGACTVRLKGTVKREQKFRLFLTTRFARSLASGLYMRIMLVYTMDTFLSSKAGVIWSQPESGR